MKDCIEIVTEKGKHFLYYKGEKLPFLQKTIVEQDSDGYTTVTATFVDCVISNYSHNTKYTKIADHGKYYSFGDALKAALEIASISQTELAKRMQIYRRQVNHWVKNISTPRPISINKINASLYTYSIVKVCNHYEIHEVG